MWIYPEILVCSGHSHKYNLYYGTSHIDYYEQKFSGRKKLKLHIVTLLIRSLNEWHWEKRIFHILHVHDIWCLALFILKSQDNSSETTDTADQLWGLIGLWGCGLLIIFVNGDFILLLMWNVVMNLRKCKHGWLCRCFKKKMDLPENTVSLESLSNQMLSEDKSVVGL